MTKRMLIDATHAEETRVVVVNGTRLEQLDVETSTKKQLKGNIYLAKVIRVEPSLQAAFVDYGGNRHGFLAFGEIHPDYYQIPVADRQALIEAQQAEAHEAEASEDSEGEEFETVGGEDPEEVTSRRRSRNRLVRDYKIQEVIKRRQILLVQVVKEERGNKGAALTTYLSLAGRYCVLMPNTASGGGVSRKITSVADRRRLKEIMADLDVPGHMAVILRTAGQSRSKAEIKRDYDYLIRTWNQIRDVTLSSRAPALIHEEGSLIKRAIRDIYASDIEEVLVDGDEGYRLAKDFMKLLTPSHAKKVQPYKEAAMPLFHRFQVDSQLDAMHSPTVQLKSGGYVVINQTEALVAIDVNSGRATKERHIEETALKTNLEAADEIARQLRLRDLAGLIVIDFIDMEESRNNAQVERRLKEALKQDRARIQMGRISHFGLLELSRQRLRPSLMETSFEVCPHCAGTGMIRSVESAAMHILRVIEEEGVRRRSSEITLYVATPIALYILNNKRRALAEIEARYGFSVLLKGDDTLIPPDHRMDRVKAEFLPADMPALEALPALVVVEDEEEVESDGVEEDETLPESTVAPASDAEAADGNRRRKRRKRRRRGGSEDEASAAPLAGNGDESSEEVVILEDTEGEGASAGDGEATEPEERRRRRRRGGRRRRRSGGDNGAGPELEAEIDAESNAESNGEEADETLFVESIAPDAEAETAPDSSSPEDATPEDVAPEDATPEAEEAPPPAAPRRRRVSRKAADAEEAAPPAKAPRKRRTKAATAETSEPEASQAGDAPSEEEKPKRRRAVRKKKDDAEAHLPEVETPDAADAPAPVESPDTPAADPVVVPAEAVAPVERVTVVEDAPTGPSRKGWWNRG